SGWLAGSRQVPTGIPIATMPLSRTFYICFISLVPRLASSQHQTVIDGYLGAATCAGCHKEIAATQSHTSMARTWQGAIPAGLPVDFDEQKTGGPVRYRLRRAGITSCGRWNPGRFSREAPVEAVVGGRRQGLSFLARISNIDGERRERSPLVEIRLLPG